MSSPALAMGGAYLLGSLPFSFWIARYKGIDLYQIGSGNVGATNVARALGPRWGAFALVLDATKGAGGIALGLCAELSGWSLMACGLCAILGHVYSVFLGFKGGKGVATSLGVFLALEPHAMGISFLAFAAVVLSTRYVSLASLLAGASLCLTLSLTRGFGFPAAQFAFLAWILLIVRHRANIQRLWAGTESRFGERPVAPSHSPSPEEDLS